MGIGVSPARVLPEAMAAIGLHASHEQLTPSALLRAVRAAEDAGFDAAKVLRELR